VHCLHKASLEACNNNNRFELRSKRKNRAEAEKAKVKPKHLTESKAEFYSHYVSVAKHSNIAPADMKRIQSLIKAELLRVQRQLLNKARPLSFEQLIDQIAQQGPILPETINRKLQQEVHSNVLEVLQTMFAWFSLPWRELTTENMFDKAKMLKKVDKDAIRFSKYLPFACDVDDSRTANNYSSKLQERLARIKDRAGMVDVHMKSALQAEELERKLTRRLQAESPERMKILAEPLSIAERPDGSPFRIKRPPSPLSPN